MTKLKPSSRNLINPALLIFNLILSVSLFGCQAKIEPTYKEEDIPYLVKQICKEEYGLDVSTRRLTSTLWVYAPMSKILHQDYGITEDKIFDEEMVDKLRNILTTIGRVLISSDNTPEFYVLVSSDINLGLDYTIIANVLDIKKSYANFIPWTEANRRYVIKLELAPDAIKDTTGSHVNVYDIRLEDFLAQQIAQRIGSQFQGEDKKKYFKVQKSEGNFRDSTFVFEYEIQQIATTDKEIDIKKEILDTITYCVKTYEFKDFSLVEINDLIADDKLVLSKAAIWTRSID